MTSARAIRYALHGLRVACDLRLDAWEIGIGEADLSVTTGPQLAVPFEIPDGEVIAHLDGDVPPDAAEAVSGIAEAAATCRLLSVGRQGETFVMRYHGFAEITADASMASATLCMDHSAEPDLAATLVTGGLGSLVASMREGTVLHASAVSIGAFGVAFPGMSGSGKSTVSALACAAGGTLLADDALRIVQSAGVLVCFRASRSLRLRPAASRLAGRFPGSSAEPTSDRRIVLTPPTPEPGDPLLPVRMGAVVLPVPDGRQSEPELRRLGRQDALLALLPHSRLANLSDVALLERHFRTCTAMSRTLPVFRLTLPSNYWQSEELGSFLVGKLVETLSGLPT